MILQVIVDRLILKKEGITKTFGETFEVSEDRAKEILNYKFNGKSVVSIVKNIKTDISKETKTEKYEKKEIKKDLEKNNEKKNKKGGKKDE